MPMQRHLYPKDWEAMALAAPLRIALQIKQAANWRCENCHRPCRKQKESKPEFRRRLTIYYQMEFDFKPGRFILTTSHQDHDPSNCDPSNLKALCSVCHLRFDAQHHAQTRAAKKTFKQLSLFEGV